VTTGTPTRRRGDPTAGPPRLPTQARDKQPVLVAAGLLLIVVGALAGLLVQQRAGDRITVIQVTSHIPAGQQIGLDAIRQVAVAPNSDIAYVDWDQRGQLTGYWTQTAVLPGTVLIGGMLTATPPPATDQVIVGLSLSAGQYPPELQIGDRVNAIHIGDNPGSDPILADSARIYSIATNPDGDLAGDATVSLVVTATEAPALAAAADAGDVALALLPGE
jgi:hypothetical protein